jgi:hypothetical protein
VDEEWEADKDEVRAAGGPAAEAARWRPDRSEIASVPSADEKNPINAVCPASSASARTAGL